MSNPSPEELLAFAVVQSVLQVDYDHWDTGTTDRQGAVDAHLRYRDGHEAALEVTTLGVAADMEFDALLAREGFTWPSGGDWWWHIDIPNPRELRRIRRIYPNVIGRCEAAGVTTPRDLPANERDSDVDLSWLLYESTARFRGLPGVPNRRPSGNSLGAFVSSGARGGFVDENLAGLHTELTKALNGPTLNRRVTKLLSDPLPERQLFVIIKMTALDFSSYLGLMDGERLLPDPPPLPTGITHLWLMPAHGRHVYLWSRSSWSLHCPVGPYDPEAPRMNDPSQEVVRG